MLDTKVGQDKKDDPAYVAKIGFDAMTNGGLGVAFFSPFDNRRYFLPWRPILVSPIAVTRFFSPRGYAILRSELVWIWLPAILFGSTVLMLRRKSQPDAAMPNG